MLGRRRAECTTGRSGVTVKAPNFQFAAFILHIPQRSLPQLCYSPPGLILSPCAFCECLRVSLRRGRAVVVPRDVYYTSTDEQL